jgi:AcrR family transcriptional regulator
MPRAVTPTPEFEIATSPAGLTRLLDAVERLLVRTGYARVTMRAVAEEAKVSVGTVSHFGSREQLVEKCVNRLIGRYLKPLGEIMRSRTDDPRAAFVSVIRYIVDDLETEATSRLFTEVWAMANHNPHIQAALDRLYGQERAWLETLLLAGWPGLSTGQTKLVIGTLIPMIEGQALFAPPHRAGLYNDYKPSDAVVTWLDAVLESFE